MSQDEDQLDYQDIFASFVVAPNEILINAMQGLATIHRSHLPCTGCEGKLLMDKEELGGMMGKIVITAEDVGHGLNLQAKHYGPHRIVTAMLIQMILQYRKEIGMALVDLAEDLKERMSEDMKEALSLLVANHSDTKH